MKATLEFILPQEQDEYDNAINGSKYKSALWDFDQWLRGKVKYGEEDNELYEEVREKLSELMSDNNVTFE